MLSAFVNAFKVPDLRNKMLFTLSMILLYRVGSYLPVPFIPFQGLTEQFQNASSGMANTMALLNLFSGGALSQLSIFSLGIMPYITSSIIMQMMQAVVPSLGELAKEGEAGQRKITQYTRYLTLILSLVNAVGYLALFKGPEFGLNFSNMGVPELLVDFVIVISQVVGSMLIMWLGELITQHGVGNGMSLIIFSSIMARLPQAIFGSVAFNANGVLMTIVVVLLILITIPLIIFVERGQRRIPIQYAKRVVGRKVMGGSSTYLPIKVNTAGVIPIIFASAILYFPAQIAIFFSDVQWLQSVANTISAGPVNWIFSVIFIVFFAYFYTAMVFNPEDTADNLKKQGGFIPGIRPGGQTVQYIKNVINRITLPGAIFIALVAVVPSIFFFFTNNPLIQAFGGTSILIMVGVALDTMTKIESQLKMHDYEGFFK
ncbi:MAG: preprotein translocase subunit SecY [Coriobacteriia bacterium]|nr:preprotein translocase subunit SecY [Coriobacteriia bacterium]